MKITATKITGEKADSATTGDEDASMQQGCAHQGAQRVPQHVDHGFGYGSKEWIRARGTI